MTPKLSSDTSLPTVAMVGGGQLARMTHQAAIPLGVTLRILTDDPGDSAALVSPSTRLGKGSDPSTLLEFSRGAAVLTFDHEHVPLDAIRSLERKGVKAFPSSDALQYAQDKLAMRQRLTEAGYPAPPFRAVADVAEVITWGEEVGWPLIVKTPRGGYDGKGVWQIADAAVAHAELPSLFERNRRLLVEQRVPLMRELAALVARSPYGQVACWPITETVQRDGICVQTVAPAPGLSAERSAEIEAMAIRIATELNVVGVMAVELFDIGGRVLINELAMRPHNSGHWTIEGAATSQFEQHLRAVLDYPLGSTRLRAPHVVMANVLAGDVPKDAPPLDERLHHAFAYEPAIKVHLYGKEFRPGRKVGHVTMLGGAASLPDLRERTERVAVWLGSGAPLPE
ncbi:MAG TPA: 5-(carboxyamino)imidazole ribonucleotide synthase [Mycobacteriales bacterium]|nr:5-(carboxyamino)imidazole ribonucleotide synthase [Mycobacteriales bacterium]